MKLPRVCFGLLGLAPMAYTSFSGRLHSSERHDEPDRRSQPVPINLETRHEIKTGNSSPSPAPNDAVLSALGGLEHYKAAAMAEIIVPLVAGARPSDGLQERLWELLKTLTEASGVDAFDKWESHYSELGIAAYIGLIRVGAMIAANPGNSTILSEAMKDSTASPAIKVHQDSSTNPSKVLFQQYPASTWPQDKWIGTTAINPLFDWGDLQWEALLELEERIYEQEKLLPGMLSEEQNLATQQLQIDSECIDSRPLPWCYTLFPNPSLGDVNALNNGVLAKPRYDKNDSVALAARLPPPKPWPPLPRRIVPAVYEQMTYEGKIAYAVRYNEPLFQSNFRYYDNRNAAVGPVNQPLEDGFAFDDLGHVLSYHGTTKEMLNTWRTTLPVMSTSNRQSFRTLQKHWFDAEAQALKVWQDLSDRALQVRLAEGRKKSHFEAVTEARQLAAAHTFPWGDAKMGSLAQDTVDYGAMDREWMGENYPGNGDD